MKKENVGLLTSELNANKVGAETEFVPMQGGKGEFFIYHVDGENKKILFSNNSDKHKAEGAVIGMKLNAQNVKEVAAKVL